MLAVFVPALLLVALSFVVHGGALPQTWLMDDPAILDCAVGTSVFDVLTNPDSYHRLSTIFFTPMQVVSFAVDYALFGIDPFGFYVHHVLSIGFVAAATFALLRRWHSGAAWTAALLFIVAGPTVVAARYLMLRHYFEGALCALLAAVCLRGARRVDWRSWCAAALYLVAMLYKETYVLVGLAAPWLPPGTARQRWWRVLPFVVALAVYVLWRLAMIGASAGYSYLRTSDILDPQMLASGVAAAFGMLAAEPVTNGAWTWGAIGAVAVLAATGVVLARGRGRRGWLVLALLSGASVMPVWALLPRDSFAKFRLLVHVSLVCAIAIGVALAPVRGRWRWLARAVIALALGGLLAARSGLVEAFDAATRCHAREVEFLWGAPGDHVLVASVPFTNRPAVARLRAARGETTPVVCTFGLDLRPEPASRYFAYSATADAVVDVTVTFQQARRLLQQSCVERPFQVLIRAERGVVSLELDGGRVDGRYFLLQGDTSGVYELFPVPPQASYEFSIPPQPTFFRLLKENADGTRVLSPEWGTRIDQDFEIRWQQ